MKLRKGNEMVCIEHHELERKNVHFEVRYEKLVEKLKKELYSVVHATQEGAC